MGPSTRSARLPSSAATANATVGFDGPVDLEQISGENVRNGRVFLKLYQLGPTLAAPLSTDTPFLTISLPAQSAFVLDYPNGVHFNFGMGYRLVTGSADNDATAIAAGDILGLNFLGN